MKFLLKILTGLIFIFCSCTNMQTEIAKKWKLSSSVNPMRDTLFAQMNREIRSLKDSIAKLTDTAQLVGMQEQLSQNEFALNLFNQNVNKLMNESFIDLNPNGLYKTNITGAESGKWELSSDKKSICFHSESKAKSDTMYIKEFKAGTSLILAFDSSTYLVFQPE